MVSWENCTSTLAGASGSTHSVVLEAAVVVTVPAWLLLLQLLFLRPALSKLLLRNLVHEVLS